MDMWEIPGLAAYVLTVTCVLGLVMGSFLNCLAWRLVNGESVLHGRSHCTSCGHVLGPADLVPVVSWLATRGRCRYCGAPVSVRYPAVEVLCAVVYVTIVWRYGLTWEALDLLCFASALLVLSLTDIDAYLIPDGCLVFAAVAHLACVGAAAATGSLQASLADVLGQDVLSAVCVGLALWALVALMDRVLGRDSMGGGDIKLLTVAAFVFGWQKTLFLIVVACVIGIATALVVARRDERQSEDRAGSADAAAAEGVKTVGRESTDVATMETDAARREGDDAPAGTDVATRAFPWGPSIALACWVTMLCGDAFAGWYASLL
jgi:leader peptidase (prepilin peptidase)/N-methyltransferase